MRKPPFLWIGMLLLTAPAVAHANTIIPTIGKQFVALLSVFLFSTGGFPALVAYTLLIPFVLIGFLFQRKFVAVWSLPSMFGVLFAAGILADAFFAGPFRGAGFP